jgi:hypothetical protein
MNEAIPPRTDFFMAWYLIKCRRKFAKFQVLTAVLLRIRFFRNVGNHPPIVYVLIQLLVITSTHDLCAEFILLNRDDMPSLDRLKRHFSAFFWARNISCVITIEPPLSQEIYTSPRICFFFLSFLAGIVNKPFLRLLHEHLKDVCTLSIFFYWCCH